MALNALFRSWRRLLELTLLLLIASAGCDRLRASAGPQTQPPIVRRTGKATGQAPAVLVLMPPTEQARSAWVGLSQELAAEFDVVAEYVEKDSSVEKVAAAITRVKPVCLVLMDNPTVRIYGQYQQNQPPGTKFLPAVIILSSFLEQTYESLQNATGISYELPGVTQFAKLRSIMNRPVRKVGVVYRNPFAPFIARQRERARREQFDLIGIELGRQPSASSVTAALRRLLEQEQVDALWILNDNGLLSPALVSSVWYPALETMRRVPVIVGVRSFVDLDRPLGSFAMLPDHIALGAQAADMVFDLADRDWNATGQIPTSPVAITTIVNLKQVQRNFRIDKARLDGVDELVE